MSDGRFPSVHPDYEWSGAFDYENRGNLGHIVQTQPLLVQQNGIQTIRKSNLIPNYRPNTILRGSSHLIQSSGTRKYTSAQPDFNWQETGQYVTASIPTAIQTTSSYPLTNGIQTTTGQFVNYQTSPYLHTTNTLVHQQNRALTPLRRSNNVVLTNQIPTNRLITTNGIRGSGYIKQMNGLQIVGNNNTALRKSQMEIRGSSYRTGTLTTGNLVRGSNYAVLRGSNYSNRRVINNGVINTGMINTGQILRGSQHSVRTMVTQPGNVIVHQQPNIVRGSHMIVQQPQQVVLPNIQQLRPSQQTKYQQQGLEVQVENPNNQLRGSKYRTAPPPPAQ